jgi:uncharacterized protein (UPF0216 family)
LNKILNYQMDNNLQNIIKAVNKYSPEKRRIIETMIRLEDVVNPLNFYNPSTTLRKKELI